MTAKLATRKYLAGFDFQDKPMAPNAANMVRALTSNKKSAASERAVTASGTKPAYRISSRTSPNEIVASQAYNPMIRGPIISIIDIFSNLIVIVQNRTILQMEQDAF